MAAYEKLPYWADVKLTGGMLADIQKKVGTQMLPFQWRALNDEIPEIEKSHCVENFRIAAGESQEKFYGMVFQDSDLAKWLGGRGLSAAAGRLRGFAEEGRGRYRPDRKGADA